MVPDTERKRELDRAAKRGQKEAAAIASYDRQPGPEHDEPPPGVTLEQHRYWACFVLGLISVELTTAGLGSFFKEGGDPARRAQADRD
jgi:hypothetical protein